MQPTLKYFSATPCNGDCSGPIERTTDNILTIRDTPTGFCPRNFTVTTEIDLPCKIIRKTWKAFVFAWRKHYPLDDYETAKICDKSRLIEGYQLPFFAVYLVGRNRRLKIYSTDDLEEATAIKGDIAGYLGKSSVSTLQMKAG